MKQIISSILSLALVSLTAFAQLAPTPMPPLPPSFGFMGSYPGGGMLSPPMVPSCFGEKNSGIEVTSLNLNDQGRHGTCYSHAPTTMLEAANYRRTGENQRFSVDFGVCLASTNEGVKSNFEALQNSRMGEAAGSGGDPSIMMQVLLREGHIPKQNSKSGKAVAQYLNNFRKQMDQAGTLFNINWESIKLSETYQKLKDADEKHRPRFDKARIDRYELSRADHENRLLKDNRDRLGADGSPRAGLEQSKNWPEIQKAWINRSANEKTLKKFEKRYGNIQAYSVEYAKIEKKAMRAAQDLAMFESEHKAKLVTEFSKSVCVKGECLPKFLENLRKQNPKDFVKIDNFAKLNLNNELFGKETCDPTKLFNKVNELLCVGMPLMAGGLKMGPKSNVKNADPDRPPGQSEGLHVALLSGIRPDKFGGYDLVFHNSWGAGSELVLPARDICQIDSLESLNDKNKHEGEEMSEFDWVQKMLREDKPNPAPIMSKARENFRLVRAYVPEKTPEAHAENSEMGEVHAPPEGVQ